MKIQFSKATIDIVYGDSCLKENIFHNCRVSYVTNFVIPRKLLSSCYHCSSFSPDNLIKRSELKAVLDAILLLCPKRIDFHSW